MTTTIEQQIRAIFHVDSGAPEWEVELLTPIQAEGETDHAYLTRCKHIAKERDNARKAEAKAHVRRERWQDVRDAIYDALPDYWMPGREGYAQVSDVNSRESLISFLNGYGAYVRDMVLVESRRAHEATRQRDMVLIELRDAHETIDAMRVERRAARAFFGIEKEDDEPVQTPMGIAQECVRLFPGQKINAIKELRQRIAGLGLKEAKDLVDAITNSTSLHG